MITAETRSQLRHALAEHAGRAVGFVPTMGALHTGHTRLLDKTRERADVLVVSIFVNPLQFGPNEDLSRYPRTLDADLSLCEQHGADVVFVPDLDTVYPGGQPQVRVAPGPLGDLLEGAARPGHFAGVLTVVNKFFNLVQPDIAAFGEKDYQQLVLIRRMVADLCMSLDVIGVPTVREGDGLAHSSRNRHLSADERQAALALGRALRAGQQASSAGLRAAMAAAQEELLDEPRVSLDYLAVRDPDLADPPSEGAARMLVAAKVGSTRLIDNVPLVLGPDSEGGA